MSVCGPYPGGSRILIACIGGNGAFCGSARNGARRRKMWRPSIVARYGAGADGELFCVPSQARAYLTRAMIVS